MRIPDFFFLLINPAVRWVLRSPFHAICSDSLMLITFTGRKSGKIYTTPVRYLKMGDAVWSFTSEGTRWWRNLRGGADVTLRIRGEVRPYRAVVDANHSAETGEALREFLSHFPQDASYYGLALGPDRRPSESDLQRAAKQTIWMKAFPA